MEEKLIHKKNIYFSEYSISLNYTLEDDTGRKNHYYGFYRFQALVSSSNRIRCKIFQPPTTLEKHIFIVYFPQIFLMLIQTDQYFHKDGLCSTVMDVRV